MFVSNKSFPFWNGFGLIGLDTIPPPKAAQDQGDRRGGNCRKHFWKQDVWAAQNGKGVAFAPTPGVTFAPTPKGVTFAPTPLSFPLNVSFNLLGFDLGTRDI